MADQDEEMYPLLKYMRRKNIPETRENYLAIDGWDNPRPKLSAEEEGELPPQFRKGDRLER